MDKCTRRSNISVKVVRVDRLGIYTFLRKQGHAELSEMGETRAGQDKRKELPQCLISCRWQVGVGSCEWHAITHGHGHPTPWHRTSLRLMKVLSHIRPEHLPVLLILNLVYSPVSGLLRPRRLRTPALVLKMHQGSQRIEAEGS